MFIKPTLFYVLCYLFIAYNGHLNILQWAKENDCEWSSDICSSAAENGHLHVLKWARSVGSEWDPWIFERAAANGHMHVVQWAFENGCPWHRNTCAAAAEGGHLDILKWVRSHGCPWDVKVFILAGLTFKISSYLLYFTKNLIVFKIVANLYFKRIHIEFVL